MSQPFLRLLPRTVRRGARRLVRRWLGERLEVVYADGYNAAFPSVPNDPLRSERILAFLASEGLVLRREVHDPVPASLKALERVHGAAYLDSLHETRTLASIMGVDVTDAQVDRLIDFQRLETGGTLRATRRALAKRSVAVNLGGGFHHAHADQGGGFCLFNDVAVAIAAERRRGFAGRVLVVDLDLHDGDGTRSIFADDPDVYTFSIHARHWGPTEALASTSIELGGKVEDGLYLETIHQHLDPVMDAHRPELVIYLAGCDPAVDDELGDWRISAAGMLERDRHVVGLARRARRKLPTVVLLAGGYGLVAWRYTARFLADLLNGGRPLEPPSTEEITLKRYRYLASLLGPEELSGAGASDSLGLTEEDLFLPGWGVMKETRFLGYYTKHGIELALERAGVLDRLRDLGFADPTLDLDLADPGGETLRIYGSPTRRQILAELRVRRDRRTLPEMELLSIEWLLLQNPRVPFGTARPQLPGQAHPGLGLLRDVVALLTVACERLHLDGILFVPSQFHVACQWYGQLFFLKPETRRSFAALWELLRDVPLAEASQAVAAGRVVDERTGEPFRWHPEPMVLPVSERLRRFCRMQAGAAEDRAAPTARYRLHRDSEPATAEGPSS